MRKTSTYAAGAVVLLLSSGAAPADINKTPYAAVKVELSEAYKPDAAFEKMRHSFLDATRARNADALFALVAPGFVWTVSGALSGDYDTARGPLHNFKVLFGFRKYGSESDGGVDGGPYWDALGAFAEDGSYYKAGAGNEMVCSPMSATVEDDEALEAARKKIDTEEQAAQWYFTLADTPVLKTPGDKGAPIETLKAQAVPVLSVHPAAADGAASVVTHYEVLLPSGKTGWVTANAVRPLMTSRLCFAQTAKGDWVVSLYDGLEQEE